MNVTWFRGWCGRKDAVLIRTVTSPIRKLSSFDLSVRLWLARPIFDKPKRSLDNRTGEYNEGTTTNHRAPFAPDTRASRLDAETDERALRDPPVHAFQS